LGVSTEGNRTRPLGEGLPDRHQEDGTEDTTHRAVGQPRCEEIVSSETHETKKDTACRDVHTVHGGGVESSGGKAKNRKGPRSRWCATRGGKAGGDDSSGRNPPGDERPVQGRLLSGTVESGKIGPHPEKGDGWRGKTQGQTHLPSGRHGEDL
jgi:hypothetical protein